MLKRYTRNPGRREDGAAMLTAVFSLVALLAAGTLAIDAGYLWTSRTQLQNVADGAALAAAAKMIDASVPSVTLTDAENAAVTVAAQNAAGNTTSVTVNPTDMTFGDWDLATRTLDTTVDLSVPANVTGVEVLARLDNTTNSPVPAFLSRLLGKNEFPVTARATAYLGYAGKYAKGTIDLPIGIDCCALRGSPDCDQDYCDYITNNPPNFGDFAADVDGNPKPCKLADGTDATCLDFYATGNQIACWTNFSTDNSSVSTSTMQGLVATGNPHDVAAGEYYYLDNGTKTPVVDDIAERFYGTGAWYGKPDGKDTNGDGISDSWVVSLPVFECQEDMQCAKGDPAKMLGGVCFEIKEVIVTPDKRIKGYFLCQDDVKHKECDLPTTTGGEDFDVRAQFPVLVR